MGDETDRVWLVELQHTRRAALYIKAASRADAIDDAEQLVMDEHFVTEDDEEVASCATVTAPKGCRVWSGGPNGDWITQ